MVHITPFTSTLSKARVFPPARIAASGPSLVHALPGDKRTRLTHCLPVLPPVLPVSSSVLPT